jgi:glycosyltransferase involved in cell wall biosynthesis
MKNTKNKINILHLTPHLGGGVGRVVLNYLVKTKEDPAFEHKIICFDYANENALAIAKANDIELFGNAWLEPQKILSEVEKADIVLIHWWNHPLLYDFLVRQTLPASRVILWSHVSGFHPPYVFTQKILSYPDLFVFTTPVSFEAKEVQECNKDRLHTVWSTAGLEYIKNTSSKEHKGFNVGYVGTVDYCKMHPDFLKICSKINIPDIKFIVCGGHNQDVLKQEAHNLGILDKFEFTGPVSDITDYLSIFDVFGYPLAPYHYGTCDQVLPENIASGVVPVVLANKMEKYMVKNKITGLVAENEEEYIKAIEFLYHNPDERKKLSQNAKKYALEIFSLDNMINEWEKIFNEVLTYPKTVKKWEYNKKFYSTPMCYPEFISGSNKKQILKQVQNDRLENDIDIMMNSNISPAEVFLEALGEYGDDFRDYLNTDKDKTITVEKIKNLAKSPIWSAKTRGTVHHYYEFFKEDQILQYWSKIMTGIE